MLLVLINRFSKWNPQVKHRCSLPKAKNQREPCALYDRETVGTGRLTEIPEEKANKLKEIFEIVRRNLERAS